MRPLSGIRIATIVAAAVAYSATLGEAQTTMASNPIVTPASAMSAATPLGVRALVTVEHLLLEGGTYRAVRDLLAVVGPLADSGELAAGVTDYDLVPRLHPRSDGRRCRTEDVTVDATVRILLPEWTNRGLAPAPDRKRWAEFLDNLTAHEMAHRDVTLRAADSLRRELGSLSSSSCTRLVRRVDGAVRRAQRALDEAHSALDQADQAATVGRERLERRRPAGRSR